MCGARSDVTLAIGPTTVVGRNRVLRVLTRSDLLERRTGADTPRLEA